MEEATRYRGIVTRRSIDDVAVAIHENKSVVGPKLLAILVCCIYFVSFVAWQTGR
jgi:hypothetical protein